ncbi:MAG: hypothetical protein AAB554_00610 [Patescibacteria group bacterium]
MKNFENSRIESTETRPSQAQIEKKYRNIKGMRDQDLDSFEANRSEISEYASGGGDDETRKQYYPGWTQEDFEALDGMLADSES